MKITLLTKDQCSFCDQAKEIIERLSGEFPITLVVIDLHSSEGQELAERGGILFPPGVFLGSEPFCYGRLSERKLRGELERQLSHSHKI